MDLNAFKIISDSWDEKRWRESMFIMGYNPDITKYILKNKGGVILFTRSAEQIARYYECKKNNGEIHRINSSRMLQSTNAHNLLKLELDCAGTCEDFSKLM